ncbi:TPA: mechanosensitive ion channel [Pseudomonas aeruginosa]|uniref:mechanosensitive ion channel family protein n=1 Tax=Pseudomonas aeruginosa TaxID=287 RepID=UPI00155E3E31|nr:mechanosensitive ion channel family protein [Pseudomonas aeruginosa]HCG0477460.1 mechanosensitive ion channel [Pseudomonas aeruginosa]HCG0487023.1 mechanosensitive ion channel [Pseudomonas aeruginosa]HCG0490638.1 mechanosensitive ion channel [Pseudomonas aeruginosa]HCG0596719.1 mechanosensitive ion channel [Pseudomonas aeruginosa]
MPIIARFTLRSRVLAALLLCLCAALFYSPPGAAALPNPLAGSSSGGEKVSDAQLEQSLNQVIQTLENDRQRADLLKKLKQLRDVTKKGKESEGGVLGLIGDTLTSLEKQFQGANSPVALWGNQFQLARAELEERFPSWRDLPAMVFDFSVVILLWACLASALLWLSRRMRERFGLSAELPQHPKTRDLLLFSLRKLGPWLVAFLITLYLSVVLPDSLSKTLAMVMAYVLVCGTLFSALCVISLSLLSGPHRQRALDILRRQAFRPLWLIGSLAALGEVAHDPRLIAGLGEHTSICLSTLANASAALFTALFVMRFRRPIAHLIRNQPLERRLKRRSLHDLVQLVGSLWFVPVLVLVGISLFATFVSAGDSSSALRRALVCAVLAVVAMTVIGLIRRRSSRVGAGPRRSAPYIEQLQSFGTTLLVAWLIWILTDTAIQHSLGLGGKSRPNTRALTMLPLIRNVLFATIAVIALIVALANMGMNVTPLLAGAGVIGLAIGFGAQSLVADLITGLFIIIEDSLSIDDYVDVGGHLGTVEGLTIRTVRLRDLDGVVHTIPFSEIKSIKNYSRQFGYAMFRWPVPASMPIDDAVALVREVAMELRSDPAVYRNLWSPMELQGVESFDNGQAILRFRFKTAPIKQWEVQRAFNLRLRRRLDQAGLELSMPRLNVQLSRAPKAKSAEPDEQGTPADGGI